MICFLIHITFFIRPKDHVKFIDIFSGLNENSYFSVFVRYGTVPYSHLDKYLQGESLERKVGTVPYLFLFQYSTIFIITYVRMYILMLTLSYVQIKKTDKTNAV